MVFQAKRRKKSLPDHDFKLLRQVKSVDNPGGRLKKWKRETLCRALHTVCVTKGWVWIEAISDMCTEQCNHHFFKASRTPRGKKVVT